MFGDYKVAVKLTLVNELSKGLLLASSQFKVLQKQADAFALRLKEIKSMAMAGAGLLGGAFALAAPIVYATSKAAELQKQLIGIQFAVHGTNSEMEKMRMSMEKASVPTIFSTLDVANMGKIAATSNAFTASQLTALIPAFSQFADVQAVMKDTPYSTSISDAVKLMHLAQKYSPKDVVPYFNELTKASFMMPGGIGELRHAMAYYMPVGKTALRVDDVSSIMLVTLLNRLGLSGSRGGTNLLAAMTRTIPGMFGSGLLKGKSHEALADMGFIDKHGHSKFITNGHFDTAKWVQGLSYFVHNALLKDPKHGIERISIDFQHAFGTQGAKVASLLSSPQAINQLNTMYGQFQALANMGVIQNTFFDKSVWQKYRSALTNFQNIMIDLGYNYLPTATKWLTKINNALSDLDSWLQSNQKEAQSYTDDLIRLAEVFAVAGGVTLLTSALAGLATPIGALLLIITQWKTSLQGWKLLLKSLWEGLKWFFDQLKSYLHLPSDSDLMKNQQYSPTDAANQAAANAIAINKERQSFAWNQPGYIRAHHGQHIVIHNPLIVDGKTIHHVVTKHQARAASKQPAHGSTYNSRIGLQPNMLNHGQTL